MAARMCSFTFRQWSVLACIISTRARSFRSMCREISAVANPPQPTSKPFEFGCAAASVPALAFIFGRMRNMAKKPGTNLKNEFVFFDVTYEDGSQRSNRRVPAELLDSLEKDEPARGFLIEQDREIAETSRGPLLPIKAIRRAGAKNRESRGARTD